jgi:phage tail sheath protein FI
MPVAPTYPGVYIEEIPSGVHTITGVATSIAAFVGTFERGPLNAALQLLSLSDFQREYGGLDRNSETSYAVQQFFNNGGQECWVVRVANTIDTPAAAPATVTLTDAAGGGALTISAGRLVNRAPAVDVGAWGNDLRVEIDYNTADPTGLFNLTVSEVSIDGDRTSVVQTEAYRNLSMTPNTSNFALDIVNQGSRLIQLSGAGTDRPAPTGTLGKELPTAPLASQFPKQGDAVNLDITLAAVDGSIDYAGHAKPSGITYASFGDTLQSAIRAAATSLPEIIKPLLANATVDFVSAPQPHYVVRAGGSVVIALTGVAAAAAGVLLDTSLPLVVPPAPTGTVGNNLPATPADANFPNQGADFHIELRLPTISPVLVAVGGSIDYPGHAKPAGITYAPFGDTLQNAIRAAATSLPEIIKPLLANATVDFVSAPQPHYVVRAGGSVVIALTGVAAAAAGVLLDTSLPLVVPPAPTGTVGNNLPATPADANFPNQGAAFHIELWLPVQYGKIDYGPGVLPGAVPATLPSYAQLRPLLETAIRTAAADPSVPNGLKPLLSNATVELVGAGTAANPARYYVKLGRNARPFDPAAMLTLSGAGASADAVGLSVTPNVAQYALVGGSDGRPPDPGSSVRPVPEQFFVGIISAKTGMYALDVDLFNILCVPEAATMSSADDMRAFYSEAERYVEGRRAMLIIDIPPAVARLDQMQTWIADNDSLRHPNAAVYFPRTSIPDPLNLNRPRSIGASGTIAGLYARTDAQRGVWKAPAGTEASLRNITSLDYLLTDLENGVLNPIGVNCLRSFPVYSNICWGARTLEGADVLASDWKYVPVRRLTLYLEESLYRGTKWVVFEPNDEPLWAQIRLNVGSFMQDLFRKGAFQGTTPTAAYFVKCDSETTTQQDIDNGIVNILVGFAPLKPAEFVILQIQQIAPGATA